MTYIRSKKGGGSVIKMFWSIELNDLCSKKICRPQMLFWSCATFILRWSCFIIIKTLIIFAIHSHSHCTNADLFPAYHQPPQAPVLHLRAQIGAILSTVLCRWTPLYFVIVFRIWISYFCLIWFVFFCIVFFLYLHCFCFKFSNM